MSTDRDVTRIVRSWLEEGATALPDRVLDIVLDQLPATHQRRSWWPARRLHEMNTPLRIALAAAAVLVVALLGISLLPKVGGVAAPAVTPAPTAVPHRRSRHPGPSGQAPTRSTTGARRKRPTSS